MIKVICVATMVVNLSNEPINKIDIQSMNHAKKRCPKIYPNNPCLKKFTKVEKLVYRAICGPKK